MEPIKNLYAYGAYNNQDFPVFPKVEHKPVHKEETKEVEEQEEKVEMKTEKKSFIITVITAPCSLVKSIVNFFAKLFSKENKPKLYVEQQGNSPEVNSEIHSIYSVTPAVRKYITDLEEENKDLKTVNRARQALIDSRYGITTV